MHSYSKFKRAKSLNVYKEQDVKNGYFLSPRNLREPCRDGSLLLPQIPGKAGLRGELERRHTGRRKVLRRRGRGRRGIQFPWR